MHQNPYLPNPSALQSRISSLHTQYIDIVSYTTNLISSHCKTLKKLVKSSGSLSQLQQSVLCELHSLQDRFQVTSNSMGLMSSSSSIREAIEVTQKKILMICYRRMTVHDMENHISKIFDGLSEAVCREMNNYEEKYVGKGRMKRCLSTEIVRKGERRSVEMMERKVEKLKEKLEEKDKEIAYLMLCIENKTLSKGALQNRSRLLSYDNSKCSSISVSPISVSIIAEKPNIRSLSSGEETFNLEAFKSKLANLAGLLNKFNDFSYQLEEAASSNPHLKSIISNFTFAKKELDLTLDGIIRQESNVAKNSTRDSEDSFLDKELRRLRSEISMKNNEVNEMTEKIDRLDNDINELRRTGAIIQQQLIDCEKIKEESRLENVFLKASNERLQKNIKVLQESLVAQDLKIKNFELLQSKYEEIILGNLEKSPKVFSICEENNLEISPMQATKDKKSKNLSEGLDKQDFAQNLKQNNAEHLDLQQRFSKLQEENADLREKLSEAMEMCKLLEDMLQHPLTLTGIRTPSVLSIETVISQSIFSRSTLQQLHSSSLPLSISDFTSNPLVLPITLNKNCRTCEMIQNYSKIVSKFCMSLIDSLLPLSSKLQSQVSRLISIRSLLLPLISQQKSLRLSLQSIILENESIKAEGKKFESERQKLLETRDKLLSQCNTQSDEILSLKSTQEEVSDIKIAAMMDKPQGQNSKFMACEESYKKLLAEKNEKLSNLLIKHEEKSKKLEEAEDIINQLKTQLSVNDGHESIMKLNHKIAKLTRDLAENKTKTISIEELTKLKSAYTSELSQIDHDRSLIQKQFNESENAWLKEKMSLQKTLDSYAKQLTNANIELSNLRLDLKNSNTKTKIFKRPEDYKVIKMVEFETNHWYLIKVQKTQEFHWLESLPFPCEIKDPLQKLLKEKHSLQSLNSDLCIENYKLRGILSKIEEICRIKGYNKIADVINNVKFDKVIDFDLKQQVNVQDFYTKPKKGMKHFHSEIKRRTKTEINLDQEFLKNCGLIKSYDNMVLNEIMTEREKELEKQTVTIRRLENSINSVKERNYYLTKHVEKFERLKALIAKLQMRAPNLSKESSYLMQKILRLADMEPST